MLPYRKFYKSQDKYLSQWMRILTKNAIGSSMANKKGNEKQKCKCAQENQEQWISSLM